MGISDAKASFKWFPALVLAEKQDCLDPTPAKYLFWIHLALLFPCLLLAHFHVATKISLSIKANVFLATTRR